MGLGCCSQLHLLQLETGAVVLSSPCREQSLLVKSTDACSFCACLVNAAEDAGACSGNRKYFDLLVLGEECANPKPYPDPYLEALKVLGLQPHEAIVCEDSPSGACSLESWPCMHSMLVPILHALVRGCICSIGVTMRPLLTASVYVSWVGGRLASFSSADVCTLTSQERAAQCTAKHA